jgi:hypothetical protein
MPEYRVIKKSYIHDRLYEPGEVVSWDGPQGTNLEPLGAEKRPPEPSIFSGKPGPDGGSPPPQSKGKSEFDEGGPTRQTAIREFDEKRQADQEVDIPSTEPQALARKAEADGAQKAADKPKATDEGPKVKPLSKPAAPKPDEKPPEA